MGSSSDGLHTLPEYPQNALSSAGDMRFYLQNLLDSKEKQLQQAGTLGQRVLAQQMELEERIRQLQELEADKSDDDELDPGVRDRYRELGDSIMAWDAENAQLSSAFGASLKRSAAAKSSPPFNFTDLPHENLTASAEPDRSIKASSSTSTSAAAQSRRAKNAAHRADDVEFAFEIGSGLLTEVRRLQSLLGERDKAIQDIKEEKDDLEKTVEDLKTALRQQEQSADKFKEENWNLEVTIQELRTQLADTVTTNARLESDHKRINKLLAASRDAADTHQNESERFGKLYEELKLKHENDMAIARKNTAAHAREKNELLQTVDSLKADLTRATRRFGGRSPLTPNGLEQGDGFLTPAHDMDPSDIFTGGSTRRRNKLDVSGVFAIDDFGELLDRDDSPEPSPIKGTFPASNHPSSEIEALQKRLAHAQRQINTLKGTLTKEKQMRLELHNKLNAPVVRSDSEEDANEQDARGNRRLTPFRVGGRGRGVSSGNRGMTLMQRLGMATSSPVASYTDYGDEDINGEEIPQASHVPSIVHDDDEVAEFFGSKQSKVQQPSEEAPEQPQSNRTSVASVTSVEGMDPQFANVLKRVPSNGSSYGSPLRQSVLNRSARGRGAMNLRRSRGGVPFKDGARPPSLVDPPDILAAELSGLMGTESTPLKVLDIPEEDEFREFRKELVEFGCQTEDQTPEPKSIAVELGIQVDFEPVPEQPKVELVEMSTQTEPEPTPFVIEHSEFGVQCSFAEPLPVKPVLLDVAVETETPAQAETQIPEPTYADSKRTTITASDLYSRSANSSSSSSDVTFTRQFLAIPDADRLEDDLDEGEETETGADTENEGETDADNYFDARSISMLTPASESRDDFHSVMTVTDNGYSDGSDDGSDDDDDDESIKASRLNSTISLLDSIISSSVLERSFSDAVIMAEETPKSYSTVCVSADLYIEKEPEKVYIVPPKPESKEMSIQTDEWLPPLPILSATPISPSPTSFRQHQFQFIPPPPPSVPPTPSSGSISNGTSQVPATVVLARTRSSASDRRQSIESAISSINAVANALNKDETRIRPATSLGVVDRSKPPTMVLPPPPRAPPPPNSMLPPPFIPERKSREVPPPRPSSPPPPELVRAATPVGGVYGPKSNLALRSHGSSVPPSQTGLKQPPSTSSFRSAGNSQHHYANGLSTRSMRERSNASSAASPRSSISSERDLAIYEQSRSPRPSEPPTTPNKSADITPRAHQVPNDDSRQATDPVIIHAITQTMIGEFLYKYTRRTIGKGHGERRHLRFFWVHPYTKTLYWSSADPGSSNVTESMAKSAYIEGVRSVLDPNPMPPGLYQYSVIVSTPQRDMKITCPTKERHDIWFNALKYLLARPTPPTATSGVQESPAPFGDYVTDDERQGLRTSPQSQRSVRSVQKSEQWTSTPRGQRSRSQLSAGGSIGKRSGTPALEYLRWNGLESPYSPTKSFVSVPGGHDEEILDFELHGDSLSDDGFEGLENVRACCDGRHTVGHSNKHHHHHHHHHAQNQQPPTMVDRRKSKDHQLLDTRQEVARPASPSAWSFRSRAGSTHSNEGSGGLFSLRFGSRRSAKTSVTTHD